MSESILLTIGSTGSFELKTPFDIKASAEERFACKAIRKISDYIANNENPKDDIYIANGLTETNYETDAALDEHIVSLQSDTGHWLYIPSSYILTYPLVNGIPYRSIMIGISLPSIPVNKDLSNIKTDIINLIKDTIGIEPIIKEVETSRTILLSKEDHDDIEMNRAIISAGRVTDRSRYMSLVQNYQTALDKIIELEAFIMNNHT